MQGNKIISTHQHNIFTESTKGNTIIDCNIKTCDVWVARVKFLDETSQERSQSATIHNKNINDLHVELDYPSEVTIDATAKSNRYLSCRFLQAMCPGKSQKGHSLQKGCCSFENFEGKAIL